MEGDFFTRPEAAFGYSGANFDDFRQQPSMYLHQMKKSLPDKFVQVHKFSNRARDSQHNRDSSPSSPMGKDLPAPKFFEEESQQSEDAVMDDFDELAVPSPMMPPRENDLSMCIIRTA